MFYQIKWKNEKRLKDIVFLEGRVAKQKGENQIKLVEAEAKAKITSSESDWERIMASNHASSWKYECLVLLFSIPLILSFCGDWGREIVANVFWH